MYSVANRCIGTDRRRPDPRADLTVAESFTYHGPILDELAGHGLRPRRSTPPQQLRDAVRDLYLYEIRRLRHQFLSGRIAKRDYAAHVVALRKRYWLLSIPVELWTSDIS
jgi:hypothetical protein